MCLLSRALHPSTPPLCFAPEEASRRRHVGRSREKSPLISWETPGVFLQRRRFLCYVLRCRVFKLCTKKRLLGDGYVYILYERADVSLGEKIAESRELQMLMWV